MFNLFQSIKSLWSNSSESTSEYCFTSMNLQRGRGSNFWTDEKVAKMLDLFNKNYTYEQVGRAIGATKGQLASKVRSLRKSGVPVGGTSKVKSSSYKSSRSSKSPTKQEVDNVIKNVK